MVMDYLRKRAEESVEYIETPLPDWVSSKNASFKAWQYVGELNKEKIAYIKRHSKITDYLTKKTYQIKGSEIAKALNISRSSLMNTSSFSPHFKEYLDRINAGLMEAKETKVTKAKQNSSRGSVRSSKEELVRENKKLKVRVSELEAQKIQELVAHAFDQLPLPVKRKLGID